ncbi:SNF2 family N-terminal domain-containing protein [Phascolomyces articulosus]|uniref:SNF2 family N-terminal domain-containing protein n=1 Tax=Phascolomyces articulosus TaxID=60185 RepID=A0AAD5KQ27_9FUNG|nr:SNF2 family N-terminal domain-containing protein [Phascolomyces articulosus]
MSRKLQLFLENLAQVKVPDDENIIPDRLAVTLFKYQEFGLYFMKKAEESSNKGGILADDMGLGKTIQTIALLAARPAPPLRSSTPPSPTPTTSSSSHPSRRRTINNNSSSLIPTKTTLIVCPVSLIKQWEDELLTRVNPPLEVCVHHGKDRSKNSLSLAQYDVVITTYSIISTEIGSEENRGTLGKLHFHRVILDEAHEIKNQKTIKAEACCLIEATYRWCLSATPIQNKIDDLFSLIKFLRIQPYDNWGDFRDDIKKPFEEDDDNDKTLQKLQILFKSIALRRSKYTKIDGQPIIQLPPRNVHMTHIDFSSGEREFYESLGRKAQTQLDSAVSPDGKLKLKYNNVLAVITKLRLACLHARLTSKSDEDIQLDEYEFLGRARAVPREIVKKTIRQYTNSGEAPCSLCSDVVEDPQLVPRCGHIFCQECLDNYITLSGKNQENEYHCPECSDLFVSDQLVPLSIFFKVHSPALYDEYFGADDDEVIRVQDLSTSTKINKMLEILKTSNREARGEKTVIFSQFTSFLDLLEEPLTENGFKYLRFDGSTAVAERHQIISKFNNNPKHTVFLISLRAGGVGLNLTAANRVILMDIWWNPAVENQAIDRVHRIGQTKPVHVHRLFINQTVEDTILQLQEKKMKLYEGTLSEGDNKKLDTLTVPDLVSLFRGLGLDN